MTSKSIKQRTRVKRAKDARTGQVRASLLIAHGADVKAVQARLRHGSAKTTLDTYGHLWPDKDESAKAIVDAVIDARFDGPADSARTPGGTP
jgi:integrase